MQELIKKLTVIRDLLKALNSPTPTPSSMGIQLPPMPKIMPPTMKIKKPATGKVGNSAIPQPKSFKDPKKVAQQITNAETMKTMIPTLKSEEDEESIEKGLKGAIAGVAMAGAALMGGNASAKPMMAKPAITAPDTVSHDSGGKGGVALSTRTYGPYTVNTMVNPSATPGVNGSQLTHNITFDHSKPHSAEHAAAIEKELKGSGMNAKGILGLKQGDELVSNKDALRTSANTAKNLPIWNANK